MFDEKIEPACAVTDEAGHCLTCSDALETFKIIRLTSISGLVVAEGQQGETEIDVSLLTAVEPGSLVLVHGGVALALADEAGAA